uniref:Uncharacterized protein n=1 Tax=Mycobacterium phage Farewell TaxID=3158893 RepID=A0AAU8GQ20_9CAUD
MSGLRTSVDHLPALSVNPPGVLVLTRHTEGDETWLTVKRADPVVEFTDELLTDFAAGGDNNGMYPGVRFEPKYHDDPYGASGPGCRRDGQGDCYTNWLLHFDARDRHVVYRIGEYKHQLNSWVARWPD